MEISSIHGFPEAQQQLRDTSTSHTNQKKPREDIVRVAGTQPFDTVSNHSTFHRQIKNRNHPHRQILSRLFSFSSSASVTVVETPNPNL
ncbi:unnamed protein product [Citrullus colocynthis]|uniref:Uncharacterized protein n=1 Tax=Citrullus colocynthis TaxID=252529 RepID=A0ABP0Y918_9ROSI